MHVYIYIHSVSMDPVYSTVQIRNAYIVKHLSIVYTLPLRDTPQHSKQITYLKRSVKRIHLLQVTQHL